MKKISMLLLILTLLCTVTACSEKPLEIPAPLDTVEKSDISKAFVDNNSNGCEVVHTFYSMEDFQTYISTGSKNLEDYDNPPALVTSQNISHTFFFKRYVPIDTIFREFDQSLENPSMICTRLSQSYFAYFYNDFTIVVERSPNLYRGNTASDYYTAKTEAYETLTPFGSESIGTFETLSQTLKQDGEGYITRTVAGYEAVYEYKDHQLQSVTLIIDDCLITISRTISQDKEDTADRFAAFMENEANAAVAPFFSTDEKEYTRALAQLVTGIRARTEAGDDFTVTAK